MTRLILAALAAAAALVALLWASARDLRQPWTVIPTPDPDDDMAGVQVDVRPLEVTTPDWLTPPWRITSVPRYGTGDYWPQPWVNTNTTQTGPLGPAA